MKANFHRILLSLLLAVAVGVLWPICLTLDVKMTYLNTLFTVVSIIFSIGMGIVCSLNPGKVTNNAAYKDIKSNIRKVRDTSFWLFALISISFVASQFLSDTLVRLFEFDFSQAFLVFSFIMHLIGLLYFVFNFYALQNLKDDIEDQSRKAH